MSSIKDKNLLLLGILHSHDMHGYQLNQLLKSPASVINVGKANAYQILAKLEEKGFVTHVEKREGKRPPKLVYTISDIGKEEFKRLLIERLAEFQPIEYPDGVSLNLIELLKPQEALSLLLKRQERLAIHCETLNSFSDEIRASHPGIDFLALQTELESNFLNNLVEKYQHKIKDDHAHNQNTK